MSARDKFHQAVRNALEKDGWVITHDPLYLLFDQTTKIYVDLAAEKVIVAEKASRRIAVEVKTFLADSPLTAFHAALGQFLNYRIALESMSVEHILYLAVPKDVFTSFLDSGLPKRSIEHYQIKLLVYEPQTQEIVLWKE